MRDGAFKEVASVFGEVSVVEPWSIRVMPSNTEVSIACFKWCWQEL
jgi:hypothetical protein